MRMEMTLTETTPFDVVVCGGGPAGFCAALAAGRHGARTILLERYGMCGGTMTIGGISAPALFHAHGRQIIAGLGWELMTRLADQGFASLPPAPYLAEHPLLAVHLNAFQAAVEIDRMLGEAGVTVGFHQPVVSVLREADRIAAVVTATETGLQAVPGQVVIDCTGNGLVSAAADVPFELAAELQPATLNFVLAQADYRQADPAWVASRYADAVRSGRLSREDIWGEGIGAFSRGRGRVEAGNPCYEQNIGSNLNHVYPYNSIDERSRSAGEVQARRSIDRVMRWLRAEIPGYENAFVAALSPAVAARESRRILGRAYITGDDYVQGVCPPDSICYSFYPIDLHHAETASGLHNEFLDAGKVPGIPYGALVPRQVHNLLAAGRIASGDRRAQSAFRVQASCMAMGEAAGTAAALAVKSGLQVDQLDPQCLRQELAVCGAIIPGLD